MMHGSSTVLEKPKCNRILISHRIMAAAPRPKSAVSAKTKMQLGTKKVVSLNKTKEPQQSRVSPLAHNTVGSSSCPKCENVNRGNMVECRWCFRWFHNTCESLELSQIEFLANNKQRIPYSCMGCLSIVGSYFCGVFKESHENLKESVSQTQNSISLIENRLKAVEQLSKFEENVELQAAVDNKLGEYMKSIKSEIEVLENNFERFSAVTKSDFRGDFDRRNRIVIFDMPNFDDDAKAVRKFIKFLTAEEIKIKKIFRLNSKPSTDEVAPPLNVEFYSMEDKMKILKKNKIWNERTREPGYFNYVSKYCPSFVYRHVKTAPDRSFGERQKYRQLRVIMDQRNSELNYHGIANEKWIIKKMCLEKVQVKHNE